MSNWIGGLFAAEKLLPAPERIGEIPTTRETYKNLINIALPSVMELTLVSMMASIDTMMVGGISPAAIAATGLTGQPRMLILCIFFALNIGVTAVVARRRGEERQGKANEALRNALVIIVLVALLLMATVLPFTRPLMRLAGAKDDTVDMASQYFIIVSSVLPLNAATLCINAAQRGVGNTRITMYVNLLSNGVNIFLNFVLINGYLGFPKLGVLGAAIATAIGFVAGFFLSLYSVVSHKSVGRFLHINILHDDWRLRKDTLQAIGKVGGNAMLEQVALRVGFFLYARLVADLGTISFAAHQVCQQFLNLSFNFGDGIGVASTSLVGQMLGRKRPDLAKLYGKTGQRMALVCALGIASLVVIFRYPLVGLFSKDQQVIMMAAEVMLLVAAFQPFQTTSVVISGALRGAGDTRYVAMIMLLCVSILRPLLAYISIYVLGLGLVGGWAASLVDMLIRVFLVVRRFNQNKWQGIRV